MDSPSRLQIYPVITKLLQDPKRFDFVQALRLLELTDALRKRSDAIKIVRQSDVVASSLKARFLNDSSVNFPVAPITSAVVGDDGILKFTVSGFGLTGAVGVLPYSYSYLVNLSITDKNFALKSFLDIFQNRAVHNFYLASSKYRIVISYDRGTFGDLDKFKASLESFIGFSCESEKNKLEIPDEHLLYYAGFFSSNHKTHYALETILHEELGMDVKVIPFAGRWITLDSVDQTQLPSAMSSGTYNSLGREAVVGERVWSVQNSFRIMIGPINKNQIYELLPQTSAEKMIRDIVEVYCGKEYEYEIQFLVDANSVPYSKLSNSSESPFDTRLGQTSWLLSSPSVVDRDDAIFKS